MANSPLIGKQTDLLSLEVLVDGSMLDGEARVISVEVDKGINKIARADIVLVDGNLAKQEFKLQDGDKLKPGKKVEIKAGYHQETKTIFKGIIIKTGVRIRQGQHSVLYAECADESIKMTMSRETVYFNKKKDSQAITTVIGDYGLQKEVKTTTIEHEQLVQYYSTDWDFVVSRAEVNGLVVYSDDNKVYVVEPETSGSELDLNFGQDIIKSNIYVNGRAQLKEIEGESWDYSQQKLVEAKSKEPSAVNTGNLTGKSLANDFNNKKHKLHHSAFVEKAELEAWMKGKMIKSRFSKIQGTITYQGNADQKPNTLIKLTGLGKYFKGEAYVSGVSHRITEGNWITEAKIGLDPEWFSETKPLVQSSAAAGLLPGIEGLYMGTVKKIHDDPENEFRVQVDVPMIEKSGKGLWARLSSTYASDKFGSFCYPEVKDEVILGFVQSDPRHPIILGSVYSSKYKPPYTPDEDNSIQAFVTKSKLKMIFEDDDKNIIFETPGGHSLTLSDKDKEIVMECSNGNKIVLDNKGILIKSSKDVNIEAAMMKKVNIKGPGGVAVDASGGDVKLKAQMSFSAKGQISATVDGGMATIKATGICTVKGNMVMIN